MARSRRQAPPAGTGLYRRGLAAAGPAEKLLYRCRMSQQPSQPAARGRRRRRRGRGLVLAGAALAVPALAHLLIRRRLRPPEAPGWGRTRRYAGHFGTVVFQELGAGPPVVLLHAFGPGFDSAQWRATAEALARHWRVLAPDLPGWGRSAPLPPRPAAYLASLTDFLTGVVWGPAVVVAAGHAAPYAVRLAAEHPGLVRAVALAAPLGLRHTGGGGDGQVGVRQPMAAADQFEDPAKDFTAGEPLATETREPAAADGRATETREPRAAADGPADGPDAADAGAPGPLLAWGSADGALGPLVAQLLQIPILRISVLDALTSRAVLWSFLRRHAYAVPERVDAALLEHHYRVSHLPAHRQALAAYWRGDLDLPAGAALHELRVPLWVGLGAAGGPEAAVEDVLPPGTPIAVIEGTRALPHAERPLAFSQALSAFLVQLPPP